MQHELIHARLVCNTIPCLQYELMVHQVASFCIISKYCTCNTSDKRKNESVLYNIPDFTTLHLNHSHFVTLREVLHSLQGTDYNYQ